MSRKAILNLTDCIDELREELFVLFGMLQGLDKYLLDIQEDFIDANKKEWGETCLVKQEEVRAEADTSSSESAVVGQEKSTQDNLS